MTTTSLVDGQGPVLAGGAPFQNPTPMLVSAPQVDRRLPVAMPPGRLSAGKNARADLWLLGAHGGAGVTSLLRAGVAAGDARREWPTFGVVVLVARRTAYGLEWARDAARQHASGGAPEGLSLAGLVVVADAPGRTPARVKQFLGLVAGAFPQVWEVPWVEEWRLAGHAEPLPLPPAVRQLDRDMQALLGAGSS